MSRKYPSQSASENIAINRRRQRSRHTQSYADAHERRERAEKMQEKLEEYKSKDPEGYARRERASKARSSRDAANARPTDPVGPAAAGTGASGSILAGAGGTALAGAITLVASGAGTAYALNRTVLKDDPTAPDAERGARRIGRTGSYAGGLAGAGSTIVAIGAAGTVPGLSGAGIAAGLTAVGSTVGGGLAAGAALTVAAPAAFALAVGYGAYRLARLATGRGRASQQTLSTCVAA